MSTSGCGVVCAPSTRPTCILDALQSCHLNRSALTRGIREARKLRPTDGLWVEFGAASGRTARRIALHHFVHSFDSFLGLPETWRHTAAFSGNASASREYDAAYLEQHSFSRNGTPPFAHKRIAWHVGWYSATVPAFLRAQSRNVSFVHIDCDLYSSTSVVLSQLAPRMSPGCVVAFHELINYPEYESGELRALLEYQLAAGRSVRVLGTPATRVARSAEGARAAIVASGGEQLDGYLQDAVLQVL